MSRRYAAQLLLPEWDQKRLQESTVLIVGAGGLGLPAALYLAAMGVGHLHLADPDTVAEENLHRQPLYTPEDIGRPKVEVLAAHLHRLRPDMTLTLHPKWVEADFLRKWGAQADLWIDGTDNLASRLTLDAGAFALRKPWVYGAIFQWEGQAALWVGARYSDFFGTVEGGPSCSEAGVLGALPGIVGSLQAALAARYLCAPETAPANRLFRIDLLTGTWQDFSLSPSWASQQSIAFETAPPPLELSWEEALKLPQAYWVDIRQEGQAPPLLQMERKSWYSWDSWTLPDQPVILVCETGSKSRQIAFALRKKLNRSDIYSLQGGGSTPPPA